MMKTLLTVVTLGVLFVACGCEGTSEQTATEPVTIAPEVTPEPAPEPEVVPASSHKFSPRDEVIVTLPDGTTLNGIIVKAVSGDHEWIMPDGTKRMSPAYVVTVVEEKRMPDGTIALNVMRGLAPEFALTLQRDINEKR